MHPPAQRDRSRRRKPFRQAQGPEHVEGEAGTLELRIGDRSGPSGSHRRDPIAERRFVRIASAEDDHHVAFAVERDRAAQHGCKDAAGHFFSLNLRSHALAHLTVADQAARRKEHEMRALKRLSITSLRQCTANGRKVFYVWERAGIDFQQWHRWKQGVESIF